MASVTSASATTTHHLYNPPSYKIPDCVVRDIWKNYSIGINPNELMSIADLKSKVQPLFTDLSNLYNLRGALVVGAIVSLMVTISLFVTLITLAIIVNPMFLVLVLPTLCVGGFLGLILFQEAFEAHQTIEFLEKLKSAEEFYENTDSNAEFTLEDFLNHKQPPPNPIYTY